MNNEHLCDHTLFMRSILVGFRYCPTCHSFSIFTSRAILRSIVVLVVHSDCIKVLIKNGADPRATDHEGTTSLDIAKDEETRAILHKANRHKDSKQEKQGEVHLKFQEL